MAVALDPVPPLKLAVALGLTEKPAWVPVSGVFSLSWRACHWKPKVRWCLPLVHRMLSCAVKLVCHSVNACELVPSQLTGLLFPLKETSGNPVDAMPAGKPVRPALLG